MDNGKTLKFTRAAILLLSACVSVCVSFSQARAQTVADKWIASVNSGAPTPDLITYSDLLWQLALQPAAPLSNPRTEDLNRALQLIISQRLILQEAAKLPTIAPDNRAVDEALKTLGAAFPSATELMQRAQTVGLNAEQLREIVRQRLAIENYLDFRFRSFTIVTDAEIADYYKDVYVPRLRRQSPGRIVPGLDEKIQADKTVRDDIRQTLTESKIESDTDAFLDATRERADIICLDPAYRCTNQ